MNQKKSTWMAFSALLLISVAFISWKNSDSGLPVKPYKIYQNNDTTAPAKKSKKEYRVGDLDNAMKDLDKAMADMNKNMNIDFAKMDKEIKAAMEEVKKIDYEKISREIKEELSKVDWSKTKMEVEKALKEAEIEMKKVDMKEIEKTIENVRKEVSAEKIRAHIDMEKIKKEVEAGLSGAKLGLEKAKKELGMLKEFTETLEKDGLIDRKKGYKIEVKAGELYINGNKQSKEVNDKYSKYFKDEDYSITSDGKENIRL